MTTIKILRMAALALGVLLGFNQTAGAADVVYHGALCNKDSPNNFGEIGFSQFGVHNTSPSPLGIACGAIPTRSAMVQTIDVVVYDRHPSQEVFCTVMVTDAGGNPIRTQSLNTTGSGGPSKTLTFSMLNIATTGSVVMMCNLPPIFNGSVSHLASYRVRTTP